MAISWRLKTVLSSKYNIYSATELQKKIVKKTGIVISLQNLCNYINKKPSKLSLKTVELICSTLRCNLSDFCQINPKKYKYNTTKKLSFKNTPNSKRAVNHFPKPKDYE